MFKFEGGAAADHYQLILYVVLTKAQQLIPFLCSVYIQNRNKKLRNPTNSLSPDNLVSPTIIYILIRAYGQHISDYLITC